MPPRAASPLPRARGGLRGMHLGERPPVLVREHLHELAARGLPVVEHRERERAAGEAQVPLDQLAQQRLVRLARDAAAGPCPARRARARRPSAAPRSCSGSSATIDVLQRCANVPSGIVDVGDAAAHARGEVAPGRAEHDHRAAGHVLAAVVAGAFDDRRRAGIAHAEALAGDAAEVRLALDRAVHHGVADDDVLLRPWRDTPDPDRRRCARRTAPCRRSRWSRPAART